MHSVFCPSRSRLLPLAAALLLAITPASLRAQLVTNPVTAEFTASANQDVPGPDGTPLVTRYELQFYLPGAAAPFQTVPLGRPAPAGDGLIRVPLTSVMTAMPTAMMSLVIGGWFKLRTDVIAGAVVTTTLLATAVLPIIRALL